MSFKNLSVIFLITGITFSLHAAVAITGTVKDQAGTPIQGAVVSLAGAGLSTASDSIGVYSLGGTVSVEHAAQVAKGRTIPAVVGNSLVFSVTDQNSKARIDVYDIAGRHASTVLDRTLTKGDYRIGLLPASAASQISIVKVTIGSITNMLAVPTMRGSLARFGGAFRQEGPAGPAAPAKALASVDSLMAWAVGYDVTKLGIDNTTGIYDLTLSKSIPAGQVQVIQTDSAGDRLAVQPALTFAADDGSALSTATITPATIYQPIVGFGAAFTECAVSNLCKIPAAKKAEVLNAFFNPFTGSGYTLCRATINSCDFSIASYNYDNSSGDYSLVNFNMQHDMPWMIPSIKAAMAVPGSLFKLFGSPWSPPGWMKTTGQMLGGGDLLATCFSAWALYFVKYITVMKDNGIPVWGITVQNEPEYSPSWEGCRYTPEQERDFVKNYLGPAFVNNNVTVKIMIWDHNKDRIVAWDRVILGDATAAKYVWGTAYHRYAGDLFDSLSASHDLFPQYPMVATECSVRDTWTEAERMAHEIIGDLNHWSGGYLTWNLLTDFNGGPYHDRTGGCVGPIVVDTSSGAVKYNSNYYYMTHFSRYMRPGAVRIGCAYNGTGLEITAFRNTNGTIVIAALNATANPISFKVKQGAQIVKPVVPAHALIDLIY
jgi:glucosylceramidase